MKQVISLALSIILTLSIILLNSRGDGKTNDTSLPNEADGDTEAVIKTLPSEELKIMSINVYLNNPGPRAQGLTDIIKNADPDSFGVQEFIGQWIDEFDKRLPEYAHAGFSHDGRDNARYIYANYIFYKKDKYDLIDHGIFWLTDTPSIPSGNTDIAIERRTCCWAILENKETGFRYVHVNCHLESGSEEARLMQIPIVRDLILRFDFLGYPVFSTGDYNAREGSEVYQIMVSNDVIYDPKFLAEQTMDMGSYNGFGDSDYKNGKPIDFCFVTGNKMAVHEYRIIPTEVNGEFVSDHNAVLVSATVDPLPRQTDLLPSLTTDGITYEITSVRPYVAEFIFTQASELFHTAYYKVWVEDNDGNKTIERTIPSKHIDKNRSDTLSCKLGGLNPETEYTVFIAPMTITGTYNNSISFTVTTPPLQ